MGNRTKKEDAYRIIKESIIFGKLQPGQIYSITDLVELFNISRTPMREALVVLASDGFVEPIPRSGYMVTPVSIRDVLEVFHLRTILEAEAIALAVGNLTDRDIRLLEENNRRESQLLTDWHENGVEEPYQKAYELNAEFHLTIARASGNLRLTALVEQLLHEMERILVRDPNLTGHRQHLGILTAIKDRDPDAARKAMRQHLEETKNRLLSRF